MRQLPRDPEPTLDDKLASVEEHLHVIEGIALGLRARGDVLEVIDAASSIQDAVTRLGDRFGLDEVQSAAIMEMQVRRFVPTEVAKVEDQVREAREQRDRYLREGAQRR